jgi:hypothetical protein
MFVAVVVLAWVMSRHLVFVTWFLSNHRPFPPPSNAWYMTSLLCAKSQSFEAMRAFLATLKLPTEPHAVSVDPRVPRIWEEWGRGADHATPQTVTRAETDERLCDRQRASSHFSAARIRGSGPILLPLSDISHWSRSAQCTSMGISRSISSTIVV